ncbi:hypothetical protein ES703_92507 [subsurface metagenome]
MNLKFQRIDWEDDGLMYVAFDKDGQMLKWYPKWKEVDQILDHSWLTEEAKHGGRLTDYFEVICAEILLKGILSRLPSRPGLETIKADVSISHLFRQLRNFALSED